VGEIHDSSSSSGGGGAALANQNLGLLGGKLPLFTPEAYDIKAALPACATA
jgi:hypothetical protein